jgi:UDP-N-acetylglucosamine 1-carboxyvinyltransferase
MGARIKGIGSNLLEIECVDVLHGTEHTMLPDMIEVGSFIGLAAMTQSEITIKNAGIKHLGIIPDKFQQLGIKMTFRGDDIHIPQQDLYEVQRYFDGSTVSFSDHPWPGLTPDLLSIILVTAIHAKGSVLIHQKMFESRLFFVDKLIDMGAQIILCDPHRAVVLGLERKQQLRGVVMSSPDIRAGVSLLFTALSARGRSIIQNIEQIHRGYQDIEERLRGLGADIKTLH